jgi:hypothetical protein
LGAAADLQKQAALTFAMCRHALVDLAKMFNEDGSRIPYELSDRLTRADFAEMLSAMGRHRICLKADAIREEELDELRKSYEPFACALSRHFLMALPPWIAKKQEPDNWELTAWETPSDPATASDAFQSTE